MDPNRKITKKFTKKFDSKVINRQYFRRKTGLKIAQKRHKLRKSSKLIGGDLPNWQNNLEYLKKALIECP